MKTCISVVLMVSAAAAQNPGTVGGPKLGLVFDAGTGSVRELSGIPAAATVGGPIDSAAPLGQAAVSARGYAIGTEAASGAAVLVSADGRRAVPGVPAGADRIAVSPLGTAAALYFTASQTAYVLTGLPDAPQTARQVSLERPAIALAVSDDGAGLLVAEPPDRGGITLRLYQAGQAAVPFRNSHRIAGLAFLPGSANALVAQTDAVLLLGPAFGAQVLVDAHDGLADVVAAAATQDGSRVWIAMASGKVAVRDLGSNSVTSLSCACRPTGLARLRGGAVFRLNEMGDGPLWILDADAAEPRIVFVAGGAQ